MTHMETMKFIICGCTRNCETNLTSVFENIIKIKDILDIQEVIIAFDKSTDNTLIRLNELKTSLKTTHDLNITILVNDAPLTTIRVQNISNARNALLDYISKLDEPPDFFIMMDMDDVCSKPINIDVLRESIEHHAEWDAISFNNERYYDFWALSIDKYSYSCWHWNNPTAMIRAMNTHLKRKFDLARTYHHKMITCDSAFNGFAIYRYSIFKDIRYTPRIDLSLFNTKDIIEIGKKHNIQVNNNIAIPDTEHRYFHLTAKQKYHSRNLIWCDNLFPPYTGEHAAFLYS